MGHGGVTSLAPLDRCHIHEWCAKFFSIFRDTWFWARITPNFDLDTAKNRRVTARNKRDTKNFAVESDSTPVCYRQSKDVPRRIMPFQKVMPWLVESGGIAGIAKCQTFWRAMAGIGAEAIDGLSREGDQPALRKAGGGILYRSPIGLEHPRSRFGGHQGVLSAGNESQLGDERHRQSGSQRHVPSAAGY